MGVDIYKSLYYYIDIIRKGLKKGVIKKENKGLPFTKYYSTI
jgi:hypothetical protein